MLLMIDGESIALIGLLAYLPSVAKAFGIDPRRAAVARRMGPYCDLLAKPAVKAETALEAGDLSFQIGQPVCATFFPNQFDPGQDRHLAARF